MIVGIAVIILCGMAFDWLARQASAPGLIGLLLVGLLIGPFAFDLLPGGLYAAASDLRLLALVVILFRAGFEMNRKALAQVGARAVVLSFVPCLCETLVIMYVAPVLLPLTRHEAAILGAALAAVSPAVVVPYMVQFSREGRGTDKGIPTLVLAGASCDDAVAIVLCASLTAAYVGGSVNIALDLARIPITVVTGVAVGVVAGYALERLFRASNPRATKRLLILLAGAVLLLNSQSVVDRWVPYSALITVLTVGVVIYELDVRAAGELSEKLAKVWVFAQLLLFVLVGAQVDVRLAWSAGAAGAAVVFAGLAGRSAGVFLCLLRSSLTHRERLFVALAYVPKATVQAAIGATPLAAMAAAGMDDAPGRLILAVAVLSILLTAPLGAVLIGFGGKRLLCMRTESSLGSVA